MAVPFDKATFAIGELAPALFGRTDLARYSAAASTARNCFVRYQGGLSSRAGTKFVGYSKQTGRDFPPRLLTFQFNLNQGLCLEFGNFYMRVIQNGAFVVDRTLIITGASQADPCVITVGPTSGGLAVTGITNTAVTRSYAPGDHVTLAGGTFQSPAVVAVTTTELEALEVSNPGTAVYDIGDTISLTGGSQTTPAQLTVTHTQVTGATITNPGAAGTDGPAVVTGTTGTGTMFTANVTIAGGLITSVDSIASGGDYTVNPTAPAAEPVTGAGAGAQLNLDIGVLEFTITNAGVFTSNGSGSFTQNASSGSGLGATFGNSIFGIVAATFSDPGVYSSFPGNPVAQASTDGMGLGATFTCTSATTAAMDTGDWIQISGVGGMTELNGGTYVVTKLSSTTYSLADVFGTNIDATGFTAYTAGGIAERIYTLVTIYAEEDLPFLKTTQSADVMSICLVNQDTNVEYPPQDLARTTNTDWAFEEVVTTATVIAPPVVSAAITGAGSTNYQFVVTSVDPDNGTESVASDIAPINSGVNIAATAGSITVSWTAVDGVNQYNVYMAEPVFSAAIPIGVQFGYIGTAFGTSFVDSNIIPDFSQVPPKHQNPFARGQIIGVTPSLTGFGYTAATASITTSTGSGAIIRPIVDASSSVSGYIVDNPGENYAKTDTITISGDGSGATAILNVGPETGTYPAVPTYFQERRGYGFTLNQPDTYFFSQPGAFKNFDSRIPTLASDAITGNPWAVQVNGIQAMLNRPGGLVVFTGREAWQLTGTGGSSLNPQPITPATQQAQPQAFNGCHDHVLPLGIDNEILYVQAKGSIVRDLSYNYFANVYTGSDLTLNSSHLFTGFQISEWAWAEEPYKTVWAVRDDGTALCLTFVKPQEVAGWTRADTNGTFVSVAVVTEVPVDAVYWATQRSPAQGNAYMIERMDNRIWNRVEDAWCVDCGLRLDQPTPAATLNVSSATGAGTIPSIAVTDGGTGYSAATTAEVVDNNGEGPGTGCAVTLTIVGGVITAATPSGGSGYTYPAIVVSDPSNSGSGAILTAVLRNSATATASSAVFLIGNVGDVIRSGGGIMTITAFGSTTSVTVDITSPIVEVTVDAAGNRTPLPQASGNWTMTTPVNEVSALMHLAGLTVTGTYDGKAIPPTEVPASGVITLPAEASAVTVGLGFTMQVQSPYFTVQGQSVEGHRKKVADVVVRVENSLGFTVGSNQPDGSTFAPQQIAPTWQDMQPVEKATASFNRAPYGSDVEPLFTGDSKFIPVISGFGVPGQVAVEQASPFPLNVLAFIPSIWPGDTPQSQEPRSAGKVQQNG